VEKGHAKWGTPDCYEGLNALKSDKYVEYLQAKNALKNGQLRVRVEPDSRVGEILDSGGNVVDKVSLTNCFLGETGVFLAQLGPEANSVMTAADRGTFHEPAYFSAEGQPHRVDPEFLMPPDTAIRVVLHFYRTGELPSWIEWEEG
jgi:hypothetical protein